MASIEIVRRYTDYFHIISFTHEVDLNESVQDLLIMKITGLLTDPPRRIILNLSNVVATDDSIVDMCEKIISLASFCDGGKIIFSQMSDRVFSIFKKHQERASKFEIFCDDIVAAQQFQNEEILS